MKITHLQKNIIFKIREIVECKDWFFLIKPSGEIIARLNETILSRAHFIDHAGKDIIGDVLSVFHHLGFMSWIEKQSRPLKDEKVPSILVMEDEKLYSLQAAPALGGILDTVSRLMSDQYPNFHHDAQIVFHFECLKQIIARRQQYLPILEQFKNKQRSVNPPSVSSLIGRSYAGWYTHIIAFKLYGLFARHYVSWLNEMIQHYHSLSDESLTWHVSYYFIICMSAISLETEHQNIRKACVDQIIHHIDFERTRKKTWIKIGALRALKVLLLHHGLEDQIKSLCCGTLVFRRVMETDVLISMELSKCLQDVSVHSKYYKEWWFRDESNNCLEYIRSYLEKEWEELDECAKQVKEQRKRIDERESNLLSKTKQLAVSREDNVGESVEMASTEGYTNRTNMEQKIQRLIVSLDSERKRLETRELKLVERRKIFSKKQYNFEQVRECFRSAMERYAREVTQKFRFLQNFHVSGNKRNTETLITSENVIITHIPSDAKCPITRSTMKNPVMLVESGQTYECEALVQWLNEHNTDPKINIVIRSKQYVQNHCVRNIISEITMD